jgi:hypothetical protein
VATSSLNAARPEMLSKEPRKVPKSNSSVI